MILEEFEYFMTLASVVLAIGVAEFVSGCLHAIQGRCIDLLFLFSSVFVAYSTQATPG